MRRRLPSPALTGRTFWLWFGGVWLLVGVPFLCIGLGAGIGAHLRGERLDRDGRTATGMVLAKSVSSDSGGDAVEYRFTAPDGRVLRGEAEVSPEVWDRLAERGPVRVTYLPGDPEVHRIEGEADGDLLLGGIFTVLGGILTLLGGFVFLRGWGILRRGRRIEAGGVAVEGTVLEVGPGSLSVNEVPQWVVHYHYVDRRGGDHRGRSEPMPPEEGRSWQPGDRGTVRYDERDPRRSVWVGRVTRG